MCSSSAGGLLNQAKSHEVSSIHARIPADLAATVRKETNWSLNHAPTALEDAVIPDRGTAGVADVTVTAPSSGQVARSLVSAENVALGSSGSLSLGAGSSMIGAGLDVGAGSMAANGSLAVNALSVGTGQLTGTGSLTVNVQRSGGSFGTVTVQYQTANGTALAGSDYTAASGTVTFAPGVTSQPVVVAVLAALIPSASAYHADPGVVLNSR